MIRLAMAGACGRMGKTILALAVRDKAIQITGALEQASSPDIGKDIGELVGAGPLKVTVSKDLKDVLKNADVLIDFTHASAVLKNLDAAVASKTACVIGTTNLDKATLQAVEKASKSIAVIQSPNMSIGVNLLFQLTEVAAKILDESYDAEIAEIHHRGKKDSPSGTAMKLLEVLAKARGKSPEKNAIFGRKGDIGVRPAGDMGVLALRGGDVVGDHTVYFLGDGERIELSHRASSREAFAKGAILAAKFAAKKKNGLYSMREVLGL